MGRGPWPILYGGHTATRPVNESKMRDPAAFRCLYYGTFPLSSPSKLTAGSGQVAESRSGRQKQQEKRKGDVVSWPSVCKAWGRDAPPASPRCASALRPEPSVPFYIRDFQPAGCTRSSPACSGAVAEGGYGPPSCLTFSPSVRPRIDPYPPEKSCVIAYVASGASHFARVSACVRTSPIPSSACQRICSQGIVFRHTPAS